VHGLRTIERAVFLPILLLFWIATPPPADAHPMGNFSISHYAAIRVEPGEIEVRYLIDMAEIPTYQEIQDNGFVPMEDDPGLRAYLLKKSELLAGGLTLEVNGKTLHLEPISRNVIFPAGAGGLPTMKLGFVYRAVMEGLSTGTLRTVHYQDDNFAGRAGWKEIVVTVDPAVQLSASSAPETDRSTQLSNYPTDFLNSPPQDLKASFSFLQPAPITKKRPRPVDAVTARGNKIGERLSGGDATVPPAPMPLRANRQAPKSRFTELVTAHDLSFWFLFTAALIAAGLGALHALEPGHGKTIVAAYLIGSKGTARHAVFLGLIVTGAHTAGVYLLGAITVGASKYIVPAQLYPWLEMVSGIVIVVFASYLMIRVWTGEGDDPDHEPGSTHSHWFVSLGRTQVGVKDVPFTRLLTLGIAGGIVPCPAALVVLLGAFSMHRVGFGLFLVFAFSLGLAAVLVAIGLFMVYARGFVARWKTDAPITKRWLPTASAGCMLILGLVIAGRALLNTGAGSEFLAQARLPSFVGIVLVGLLLGMRHSTDPDHVIAVSTIASRERSIGQGAMIGVLWGVGHTLTIFVVGSAIILFGLAIPPRVGLWMEFLVALMLILLGILNLTGALRRWTEKLAPFRGSGTAETGIISRYGSYNVFRPLAVGLVHGLAGSAAVALLVLSTIRSPLLAVAYLLVFGAGTVVGMMLMTSAMAIPVVWTGKHFEAAGRFLTPLSGIVSTAFGLFLAYQICFVDGLFRTNVHWTPQ
jgi:nickel/cobalt exporter